ncbi:MAG: ankyrin repeat domain-containing protein [Pedobacter sp.]|jgi:ankyrin repeat protein
MSLALLEEFIQNGNSAELKGLLHKNPSLAIGKTSFNISPLMLSCYYKKREISETILNYVSEIDIFEAAALGKYEFVTEILEKDPELIHTFSDDGFTALSLSAYFGNEDITRYLLLNGADPNIPSQNGYHVYPLHSAVASDYTMLAKMLLEAGADINVTQKSGATPLHSAAYNGNIELLIVLLEAGANVNAKMEDGKTPADKALERGFTEIAKILS